MGDRFSETGSGKTVKSGKSMWLNECLRNGEFGDEFIDPKNGGDNKSTGF